MSLTNQNNTRITTLNYLVYIPRPYAIVEVTISSRGLRLYKLLRQRKTQNDLLLQKSLIYNKSKTRGSVSGVMHPPSCLQRKNI